MADVNFVFPARICRVQCSIPDVSIKALNTAHPKGSTSKPQAGVQSVGPDSVIINPWEVYQPPKLQLNQA